ncbi:MAG: ORF6N domain-containing protein, partial [Campylobacterota bacterium]|nr:ORF6N domain-containing protein [Campylobacterota bacterium]
MSNTLEVIDSSQDIQSKIYNIRGLQVMLDTDLAKLYDIETKTFNQSVRRNIKRFPEDFRFQLNDDEKN